MGQIIYFLGDIFPVFLRRFSPFCVVFGRFASFLGPNDGILLPGYRLFSRYDIYIYIYISYLEKILKTTVSRILERIFASFLAVARR